jgi:hypothetical protein
MSWSKLSLAFCAALLASGCAQMAWHKAGATDAVAKADLEACHQAARAETPPQFSPNKDSAFTNAASDAQRDSHPGQFPNSGVRELEIRQSMASNCMRGKGYALVEERSRPSATGSSSAR